MQWTDHRQAATQPPAAPSPNLEPLDSADRGITNPIATAAQVCAYISLLINPLGITSILAIIFGVIGLSRSENVVDVLGGPVGRSASKVGIILGSITFVITWLLTTLWLS